jgi:transposase
LSATRCHDEQANLFINSLVVLKGEIRVIVTVGIDLAKNVFAVHGVDALGQPVPMQPEVPRAN